VQLGDVLQGYSKALYSTWLLYRPDRFLVDCGEGCATTLGNGAYAIEKLFLTHGHIDHVSGVPSLLWARASGMGDNQKPLGIYFPAGDPYVQDLREYIEKTGSRLPFALEWHPLVPGDAVTVRAGRRISAFATKHLRQGTSLGYKVVESRKRLRPEFAHLEEKEIRERAQKGNIGELMESYDAVIAAFGGDGLPLDAKDVPQADLLVHEATLLDAGERKHQLHSTLDEAVQVAAQAGVKQLLLHHISGRYRTREIEAAARASLIRHQIQIPVWCLFRDRLWKVDAGAPLEPSQE
jgi:ribonuclease Z